jgi:hypothetical protein
MLETPSLHKVNVRKAPSTILDRKLDNPCRHAGATLAMAIRQAVGTDLDHADWVSTVSPKPGTCVFTFYQSQLELIRFNFSPTVSSQAIFLRGRLQMIGSLT